MAEDIIVDDRLGLRPSTSEAAARKLEHGGADDHAAKRGHHQ